MVVYNSKTSNPRELLLDIRKNVFTCFFSVDNIISLSRHKLKSTFYIESTLRLLWKLKDRVAPEDKKNIVYEIDCSKREAAYFGESKRCLISRSDEHKKSVRNSDCEKNEVAKHCW